MPIYAYRCEACGFQKDALQKMSDAPLVDCPACGAPKLVKQVTAAGFALKGSGWYVTDFRDAGKKPASASSDPAKPTDASAAGASPSQPGASASSSVATSPSTPAASSSSTPGATA